MKILITGTSSGIGKETALKFLDNNCVVYGIDTKKATIDHKNYFHIVADISKKEQLPDISNIDIVINNAGTIEESKAISVNLEGYINTCEKYAYNPNIKSVVIVASITAQTGIDEPRYTASQGGRISYMKYLAIQLGRKYKATVNSVSPGAVETNLEPYLYVRKDLVEKIANQSILKKWVEPKEIAELIYYLSVINKSITGQDFLIDNGEASNFNFINI